jgi:heterodisulfide reductase subunit A-like polyferredoxin
LSSAKVKKVDGSLGDFSVEIEQNSRDLHFNFGTIIVATGAEPLTPAGISFGEI